MRCQMHTECDVPVTHRDAEGNEFCAEHAAIRKQACACRKIRARKVAEQKAAA